jgi:linoleoyl-CoA desaturase
MATFKKVSFTGAHERPFHDELTRRVDAYFLDTNKSRSGGWHIAIKTAAYLGSFVALYLLVVFGGLGALTNLALCFVMGALFAAIGFNVGHDAIHGASSRRPWLNRALSLSFDMLGASSLTWSRAHNFVHHTYTNIPGVDHDLDPGPVMKFHPTQNPGVIYRLQFIYMWLLYGFTTLVWLFKKDFAQIFAPDPRTNKRAPLTDILKVFAAKGAYVALFVVVPLVVMHVPVWQLILGTIAMHFAAGVCLALVFQLAHCVEGTSFPEPDAQDKVGSGWAAHQLRTTANFGGSNPLITFLVGGLDHQVEHHLFPKICHVHYPALSPIVKQCAHEYGLPYLENPSFAGAVRSHIRLMYRFGRPALA